MLCKQWFFCIMMYRRVCHSICSLNLWETLIHNQEGTVCCGGLQSSVYRFSKNFLSVYGVPVHDYYVSVHAMFMSCYVIFVFMSVFSCCPFNLC